MPPDLSAASNRAAASGSVEGHGLEHWLSGVEKRLEVPRVGRLDDNYGDPGVPVERDES